MTIAYVYKGTFVIKAVVTQKDNVVLRLGITGPDDKVRFLHEEGISDKGFVRLNSGEALTIPNVTIINDTEDSKDEPTRPHSK